MKLFVSLILAGTLLTGCSDQLVENQTDTDSPALTVGRPTTVSFDAPSFKFPVTQKSKKAFMPELSLSLEKMAGNNKLNAMIKYEEGKELTTNLMVGIQVPGTDGLPKTAIMYFNLKPQVKKRQDGTFYMSLDKRELMSLHTADNADNTKSVVRGMDDAFLKAYKENKAQAKVYMAAIVGGTFQAKSGASDDRRTFNSFNYYGQLSQGNEFGNRLLAKDDPIGYGIDGGNGYVRLATGHNVPMQIPMTTGRWIQLEEPQKHLEYNEAANHWSLHLAGVSLQLEPYGSLIGLVYDSNNESWINTMQVTRKSGDVMIPMDTNIAFSTDFNSDDPIRFHDSYDLLNYPWIVGMNSNVNWYGNSEKEAEVGKVDTDYSNFQHRFNPVFIWVHGKNATFHFRLGMTDIDRRLQGFVPNAGPNFKYSGDVPTTFGGRKYWLYSNQRYEEYDKTFSNLENGKSYIVSINTDVKTMITEASLKKQARTDGLIITELYHDNAGNPDNYSMIELYNPTDHMIQLGVYGLVRQPEYGKYFVSGTGANDNWGWATVQDLYYPDQKPGGFTWGRDFYDSNIMYFNKNAANILNQVVNYGGQSKDREDAKRLNRFRVLLGNFDGYLGPKQTCIYAAGHWVFNDDGRAGTDPLEGGRNHKIAPSVSSSIKKAIRDGKCRFVVAVDNGWTGRANSSSSGGKDGGVMQRANTDGMYLVKFDRNQNKYVLYDALAAGPLDNGNYTRQFTSVTRGPSDGDAYTWSRRYDGDMSDRSEVNKPVLTWYNKMGQASQPQFTSDWGSFYEELPSNLWFNTKWKNDYGMVGTDGRKIKTSMGYRDYTLVPAN